MAFKSELEAHLKPLPAPFLFVGSGVSRRYLGLDGWEALLRRYAELSGQSFDYYSASADGLLPRVASLIAADLHDRWWKNPEFEESRARFEGKLHGSQSALKAEIALGMARSLDALAEDGDLGVEVDLLRKATVDGIITTNYDPLLESLFPDFEVYVGQDQMLFAHPQGVGEIYKIHGSIEEPDSLVLTAEDYERFNERNAYLAAKLLTVFVEHPVIFIGYSLGDPNVNQILGSIASVLTNDRIQELQDRLIFVEWSPDAPPAQLRAIPFVSDGFTIPVLSAKVSSYDELFEVLAGLERRLPARILRLLKERVYELVRSNDPQGKIFVQDLDADADAAEVDVVLGVGAIEKFVHSYRGIDRNDLVTDVLEGGDELEPRRVISELLPSFYKKKHVPIFKYLREAGLLDDDGALKDPASVDERVAERVASFATHFAPPQSYAKRADRIVAEVGSFKDLTSDFETHEALFSVSVLPLEKQSAVGLRRFLLETRPAPEEEKLIVGNLWFRAVCFYDWLRYSHAKPLGKRPKKRPAKRKVAAARKRKKTS